jgi:hypothetical protein
MLASASWFAASANGSAASNSARISSASRWCERERDRRLLVGGVAVAELVRAPRDAVVELDGLVGRQRVLVLEQALDQRARLLPLLGLEQHLREVAAAVQIVRIEIDRAGQRHARAGAVAELGGDPAALQEVGAQPPRIVRAAAQLVEDRRELDQRAGVPAQLDERHAGPVVRRVRRARVAVELLRPVGVADRDAEVAGVGEPARALRGQRGPIGALDEHRDRGRQLAAVAQQDREPVDRRHEVRIVGPRALEQRLRLVPVVQLRHLGGAAQRPRARLRIGLDAGQPLERVERLALQIARLDGQPRDRLDHVVAVRPEPIRLAVRVERAGLVAELALVDHGHLAEQLGPLAVVGHVVRAPAEQIDQHRPLAVRAVEHLERLVGVRIRGRHREHALEAVRGVVRAPELLPRRRDLGQPAHARVVGDVDQREHLLERQLAPALRDPGEPQQRIDVVDGGDLGERREPHHERAVGVAPVLEALGQLAQDRGALLALLGRLDARERQVDDLVGLGVEARRRGACDRALDGGLQAIRIELGELLAQRPDEDVGRAETGSVSPHGPIRTQRAPRCQKPRQILAPPARYGEGGAGGDEAPWPIAVIMHLLSRSPTFIASCVSSSVGSSFSSPPFIFICISDDHRVISCDTASAHVRSEQAHMSSASSPSFAIASAIRPRSGAGRVGWDRACAYVAAGSWNAGRAGSGEAGGGEAGGGDDR